MHVDLRHEVRGDALQIGDDAVVDLAGVGDHLLELPAGEEVPDHPNGQLGLLVEHARRLALLRALRDCLPLGLQAREVRLEVLGVRVLSRGANDHAVPRGADLLQDVLESRALLVGQAPADAEHVGVRDEHQVPAGEADLLGESRALAPQRVLRHLNHHVLTRAEHLLDAGRLALDLLVVGDLACVQDGVAAAAHVDERAVPHRQHLGADGARRIHPCQ